jgi:hypothetical protein
MIFVYVNIFFYEFGHLGKLNRTELKLAIYILERREYLNFRGFAFIAATAVQLLI